MAARSRWRRCSLNLAIRAWRWQYLLEPLGTPSFGNAFRATAVGFAASEYSAGAGGRGHSPLLSVARHERMSATGAVCDGHPRAGARHAHRARAARGLTSSSFAPDLATTNAVAFEAVKWAGGTAAVGGDCDAGRLFRARRQSGPVGRDAVRVSSGCCPRSWPGCSLASPRNSRPGWASSAGPAVCWSRSSCRCRCGCRSRSASGRRRVAFHLRDSVYGILSRRSRCSSSASRCRRRALSAAFTRRSSSRRRRFSARPMTRPWARRSCCMRSRWDSQLLLGLFFAAQEGLNITA